MATSNEPVCEGPCEHYRCKVKSLAFAFGSVQGRLQGPEGKKKFHGPTIRQRVEHEIKLAGGKDKVIPMGSRWI